MWLLLDTGLSKLFYMIRSQNHIWYEMRIGQRILFLPLRTISLIGVKAFSYPTHSSIHGGNRQFSLAVKQLEKSSMGNFSCCYNITNIVSSIHEHDS